MPCNNPSHVHVWPDSGKLRIWNCERFCGYCTGEGADTRYMQCSHLRAHVKSSHIAHDKKNVTVEPGITGSPQKHTYDVEVLGQSPKVLSKSKRAAKARGKAKTRRMSTSSSSTLSCLSEGEEKELEKEIRLLSPQQSPTPAPRPSDRTKPQHSFSKVLHSQEEPDGLLVGQCHHQDSAISSSDGMSDGLLLLQTQYHNALILSSQRQLDDSPVRQTEEQLSTLGLGPPAEIPQPPDTVVYTSMSDAVDIPGSFKHTFAEPINLLRAMAGRTVALEPISCFYRRQLSRSYMAMSEVDIATVMALCTTLKTEQRVYGFLDHIGASVPWVSRVLQWLNLRAQHVRPGAPFELAPLACVSYAYPGHDLYFWARFTPVENLTVEGMARRPTFCQLALDAEMRRLAEAGFEGAWMASLGEDVRLCDRLRVQLFGQLQGLDELHANLASELHVLVGAEGAFDRHVDEYTRADLEAWLAGFRTLRAGAQAGARLEARPRL